MPKKSSRPNKNTRKEMNTDLTSFCFPSGQLEGYRRKSFVPPSVSRPRLVSNGDESQRTTNSSGTGTSPSTPSEVHQSPPPVEVPAEVPTETVAETVPETVPEAETEDPTVDVPENPDPQPDPEPETPKKHVVDRWEELDSSSSVSQSDVVTQKEKEEVEVPKKPLLSEIVQIQKVEEVEKPKASSGFPRSMTPLNRPLPFPRANPFAAPIPVSTPAPTPRIGLSGNGFLNNPSISRSFSSTPPNQLANLRLLAQSLNIAPIPPGQHAHNQQQNSNSQNFSTPSSGGSRWDELAPDNNNNSISSRFSMSSSSSPFEQRKIEKMTNPFANRKRYTIDPFETPSTRGGLSRGGFDRVDLSPSSTFSPTPSWKFSPATNTNNIRGSEPSESMISSSTTSTTIASGSSLPIWWKTRPFSSASTFTMPNSKTQFHIVSKRELPRGIMAATSSCHRPKSAMVASN